MKPRDPHMAGMAAKDYSKQSFTFLSKKRAPYSYVKPDEAPPVALYQPKYDALDPELHRTHLDARLGNQVDIRQSFKPKPACVIVGNNRCSLQARQQIRSMIPSSS